MCGYYMGFIHMERAELAELNGIWGLAMDEEDLLFCQKYFREEEKRDPTITEIRMIDTYWSDHCRHTTFLPRQFDRVVIEEGRFSATRIMKLTYAGLSKIPRAKIYGESPRETGVPDGYGNHRRHEGTEKIRQTQ